MIVATRRHARQLARENWMALAFTLLALVLAWFDPQPLVHYQRWVQWPTLAALLGLLIAIQGIRDSALVQRAAVALTGLAHSVRTLGLLLVGATALLSTVLTNDVSLFLAVPLTVALDTLTQLPVTRLVVFEALAVNAGSTISPIGNPQNLLLWQHSQLSFAQFAWAMAPASGVMLGMVLLLTFLALPATPAAALQTSLERTPMRWRLGAWSFGALLGMVLMIEYGHAVVGALALFVVYVASARACVQRVDWGLLLTFAAIFIAVGHLGELPVLQHLLAKLDFSRPLVLYASGVLSAQVLSNVPATVLLLPNAPDIVALAVAVNVGGFGLVTGSMANLIALRLARQPHGMREFHRWSLPFLLLCAPLVYLVSRLISG